MSIIVIMTIVMISITLAKKWRGNIRYGRVGLLIDSLVTMHCGQSPRFGLVLEKYK